MPTGSLDTWPPDEEGDDLDEEEDLVGALENCTQELNKLCGGLEQLEAEDGYTADVDDSTDTLASLEEMSSECAALLACLEGGDHGFDGADDGNPQMLNEPISITYQPKEEKEEQKLQNVLKATSDEKLAHELDTFAVELNNFALCLEETTSKKEADVVSLEETNTEEYTDDPLDPATPFIDNDEACQIVEKKYGRGNENAAAAATAAIAADNGGDADNKMAMSTDGKNSTHRKEVFSQRTKDAITLHIKRLALQKRRFGNGNHFRVSKNPEPDAEQQRVGGVKVVLSKFQNTSFQQHIMRQNFARRRQQQLKEAQRFVESTRLRGAVRLPQHQSAKSKNGTSQSQAKQKSTYLDQFATTSTNSLPTNEFEPRCLCAVYLYGLRRLGTTYITFSSLAQFEQRARARFAIEKIASIYREVREAVLPEPKAGGPARHLNRLLRISSLEHVIDGDTLCITQNAYDDMTILCDWMKRRQRIVHGFQFKVQQAPSNIPTFTDEELTPPEPKSTGNNVTKPQLWDSNGRTIGVKVQHVI